VFCIRAAGLELHDRIGRCRVGRGTDSTDVELLRQRIEHAGLQDQQVRLAARGFDRVEGRLRRSERGEVRGGMGGTAERKSDGRGERAAGRQNGHGELCSSI